MGWSREDIIGKSAFELGLVRDKARRDELVEIIRKDGRVSCYEIEMVTKSGEIRLGEISGEVIDLNNKRCLILQVNDITDKKKTVKALEESREQYRHLIYNFPDGIIIHREGKILYGNPAAMKLFGSMNPEDYAGKTMFDFVPENSHGLLMERRRQFKEGKTPPQIEIKCLDIKGNKIDVAVTVSHVYFKGEKAIMTIFHDITDRKKIEEALFRSEQQYRLISDNMQDTLWLMDMDFKTVWISPSVVKTRGFTLAELQSMPLEKNLTPESYGIALKIMSEELTPERLADRDCEISRIMELEFICKDGTIFIGEISMSLLRDKEGNPSGFLGVGRDITERKKAERALKVSEEKYRNIFDNAILGIFRSTPEGVYEEVNQEFANIAGYGSPEEMIEAVTDIQKQLYVNPEDRTRIKKALADAGYIKGFETEIYHRNGRHIWIRINAKAVKDETDNIKYLEGTIEDITEHRRVEEALKESERRLKMAQEASGAGVWDWDIPSGKIEWSRELFILFGLDPDKDKPSFDIWNSVLHPDDKATANSRIEYSIKQGTRLDSDYRIVLPDGTERWIKALGNTKYDDTGKPLRMSGICLDISERKKAEAEKLLMEKQIRQAQKLESIGVLAGGIAHDFNNMLTAIIGNSELALMDISEMSPAVPRLNNINKVAMSAAGLCKQMLAYSGKGFFQMAPLNLNELIREMEQMLTASISKKAKLDLRLDEKIPFIKADLPQVQQILMNLVINSSEAIGDKPGTITIMTRQIKCSGEYLKTFDLIDEMVEGVYVCMEISDTGCGMDRETLGKIFDPFFTTKFTGRGLGLAAVLGIVRSHKGALKIYSEPGRGTSFKIFFPAIESSTGIKKAEIRHGQDWYGSGTILLVDDDEQIRNVCKKLLERIGFDVITAVDGKDALDVFSRNRDKISCVILDLTMPRMDGKEAYRELMLIDPDIKVIISSGYNEIEVMRSFGEKGPAGFIQKPYQLENMKEELKKVLG